MPLGLTIANPGRGPLDLTGTRTVGFSTKIVRFADLPGWVGPIGLCFFLGAYENIPFLCHLCVVSVRNRTRESLRQGQNKKRKTERYTAPHGGSLVLVVPISKRGGGRAEAERPN